MTKKAYKFAILTDVETHKATVWAVCPDLKTLLQETDPEELVTDGIQTGVRRKYFRVALVPFDTKLQKGHKVLKKHLHLVENQDLHMLSRVEPPNTVRTEELL